MRMWEKGYYVRYGGDTIQLGLPFVISDDEITELCEALHDTVKEKA
jgi:beta-alanine--pyruvate transaminase